MLVLFQEKKREIPGGAPQFIPAVDHGNSLGQKKRRHQVSFLSGSKGFDFCIFGGSFRPAVPAIIGIGAIPVVFFIPLRRDWREINDFLARQERANPMADGASDGAASEAGE